MDIEYRAYGAIMDGDKIYKVYMWMGLAYDSAGDLIAVETGNSKRLVKKKLLKLLKDKHYEMDR